MERKKRIMVKVKRWGRKPRWRWETSRERLRLKTLLQSVNTSDVVLPCFPLLVPPPTPTLILHLPLSLVFSLGSAVSLSTLPRVFSLPASQLGLWWPRPCLPVAGLQGRDSNGCLAKCSAIQRRCSRLSRYPASRLLRVASHTSGCHMPRGRCLESACCVTRCASPFVHFILSGFSCRYCFLIYRYHENEFDNLDVYCSLLIISRCIFWASLDFVVRNILYIFFSKG